MGESPEMLTDIQNVSGADSTTQEPQQSVNAGQISSVPRECKICSKVFNGETPATQHYLSEAHRKKENLMLSLANTPASVASNTICDICMVVCTSKETLEFHLASSRHQENVKKRTKEQLNTEGNTQGTKAGQSEEKDMTPQKLGSGLSSYCVVCECEISDWSHYTEESHMKKVAEHPKQETLTDVLNKGVKAMDSFKDKIASRNSQTSSPPPGPGTEAASTNYADLSAASETPKAEYLKLDPTFCKLCNSPFTGPTNAKQHYMGKVHKKNLKKLGILISTTPLCHAEESPVTEEGEYFSEEGEISETSKRKKTKVSRKRKTSRCMEDVHALPIFPIKTKPSYHKWIKGPMLGDTSDGIIKPDDKSGTEEEGEGIPHAGHTSACTCMDLETGATTLMIDEEQIVTKQDSCLLSHRNETLELSHSAESIKNLHTVSEGAKVCAGTNPPAQLAENEDEHSDTSDALRKDDMLQEECFAPSESKVHKLDQQDNKETTTRRRSTRRKT